MDSRKLVDGVKSVTSLTTIQSLPGVGLVASAIYDTLTISDKILYKKCKEFLDSLSSLSGNDQQGVLEQFDKTYKTAKDKQEFGERLLEYMNSLNDSYKAILAAKVFQYWMKDGQNDERRHRKVLENDFYHILEMMNNIPVDILKCIENRYSMDSFQTLHDKYSLVQYGIYTLKVDTQTINVNLGRGMNGMSSMPDDLIKKTFYGQVLEEAIWNGKMPRESEENT